MTETLLRGLVQNPESVNQTPGGALISPSMGRHGELFVSSVHGKYFYANLRRRLFNFMVTGVTVPVVASNLVSVFALYNPANSGVVAEIVDAEIGQVLATTVVNMFNWYQSNGAAAAGSTFTTPGVAGTNFNSGRVGELPVGNRVVPYSALTHSGTPVRADTIGSHGATTNANSSMIRKEYDGRLILPPGTVMSIATSTAAGTASGLALAATWIEWPFVE